jgi:IS30 family transposase
MRDYTQISFKERSKIEYYLARGIQSSKIAVLLNRHVSTIAREIRRNRVKGYYNAQRAHSISLSICRRKPYKFTVNSNIYKYVLVHLKAGWSPEQIAGRMKRLQLKTTVSAETIYQYIYKHGNKALFYYLPSKRKQRRTRYKRKTKRLHFKEKNIKYRPFESSDRSKVGHWEGDTIRFSNQKYQSVTTLVERKSRLIKIIKNERSTSSIVMKNIKDLI